jgi:thiosulfate reductase cytochrome b subunit
MVRRQVRSDSWSLKSVPWDIRARRREKAAMSDVAAPERVEGRNEQRQRRLVYRHTLLVRATHWINVLCLAILLMSGLQIFNAHPALYWGEASDFERPIVWIEAHRNDLGRPVGMTHIFGGDFVTTGVLGWSTYDRRPSPRAFPAWITVPGEQDLATGRVWHFFFAWLLVINGLVYLLYAFVSGHFSRDLVPSRMQMRHIGRTFIDHLRLRFPRGQEAAHYNGLQKLAYLVVAFAMLPLIVLAGLTMSPGVDASMPWLLDLFGGRQSARTIHFVVAGLLVLFVIVHVIMVLVSGVINNMRSMITGWYTLRPERPSRHGES